MLHIQSLATRAFSFDHALASLADTISRVEQEASTRCAVLKNLTLLNAPILSLPTEPGREGVEEFEITKVPGLDQRAVLGFHKA
jgi:hypothetical protein